LAEPPAVEPVSLYIDLKKGEKADLEIVARAALAFAGAIREVAYAVDPSLELRIELVSGTESSLSLNSLLKSKVSEQLARISLLAVAWGTISWLTEASLHYVYEKTLDMVLSQEESKGVSKDDIEAIVRRTIDAYQKQAAPKVEEIYRELDADPAISGIGASREPGTRPEHVIPRDEFQARARLMGGVTFELDEERTPRVRTSIEMLTLVSPVLLESKRRWRFLGKEGEFGASMKDSVFLDNILRGRSAIPMVAGIRLEVELQTIEDPIEDGAWLVRQRNVLHVRRFNTPQIQGHLQLSSPQPRQPPNRRRQ
jgi:hypothetical protein